MVFESGGPHPYWRQQLNRKIQDTEQELINQPGN